MSLSSLVISRTLWVEIPLCAAFQPPAGMCKPPSEKYSKDQQSMLSSFPKSPKATLIHVPSHVGRTL